MDGKIVGNIAHIHAQSAGGPRYDPNLSDEEVHGLANLILLCGPHHDIIDANPTQFDADTLRKMKADHEARDVTAPNDLFKRLIDALAPDVPDNWWERPS